MLPMLLLLSALEENEADRERTYWENRALTPNGVGPWESGGDVALSGTVYGSAISVSKGRKLSADV